MSDDDVYTACGHVGPQGYGCEKPKNHDGEHEALSISVTWPQNDD